MNDFIISTGGSKYRVNNVESGKIAKRIVAEHLGRKRLKSGSMVGTVKAFSFRMTDDEIAKVPVVN